jgi:hypothetical protein
MKFIAAFPNQVFPEITEKRFSVIRFPANRSQPDSYISSSGEIPKKMVRPQ